MAKKTTKAAGTAKPPTKTEIYSQIADKVEISRKQVKSVFEELSSIITKNLKKNGPGSVTIPGIAKVLVVRKPAQPAKKNVPNPFKPGELMNVAAKPARNVVKVRPVKALKDAV